MCDKKESGFIGYLTLELFKSNKLFFTPELQEQIYREFSLDFCYGTIGQSDDSITDEDFKNGKVSHKVIEIVKATEIDTNEIKYFANIGILDTKAGKHLLGLIAPKGSDYKNCIRLVPRAQGNYKTDLNGEMLTVNNKDSLFIPEENGFKVFGYDIIFDEPTILFGSQPNDNFRWAIDFNEYTFNPVYNYLCSNVEINESLNKASLYFILDKNLTVGKIAKEIQNKAFKNIFIHNENSEGNTESLYQLTDVVYKDSFLTSVAIKNKADNPYILFCIDIKYDELNLINDIKEVNKLISFQQVRRLEKRIEFIQVK